MTATTNSIFEKIEHAYSFAPTRELLTENLEYWMAHVASFCRPGLPGTTNNSCLVFLFPLTLSGDKGHVDTHKAQALEYWLPELIDVIATDAYFEDGYDSVLQYLRPLRGNLKRGIDECGAFREIIHSWVDNVLLDEPDVLDSDREAVRRHVRNCVVDDYFEVPISRIRPQIDSPLSETEQYALIALTGGAGLDLHKRLLSLFDDVSGNPLIYGDEPVDEGRWQADTTPPWYVLERYAGLPVRSGGRVAEHPTVVIDGWVANLLDSSAKKHTLGSFELLRLFLVVRDAVAYQYQRKSIYDLRTAISSNDLDIFSPNISDRLTTRP